MDVLLLVGSGICVHGSLCSNSTVNCSRCGPPAWYEWALGYMHSTDADRTARQLTSSLTGVPSSMATPGDKGVQRPSQNKTAILSLQHFAPTTHQLAYIEIHQLYDTMADTDPVAMMKAMAARILKQTGPPPPSAPAQSIAAPRTIPRQPPPAAPMSSVTPAPSNVAPAPTPSFGSIAPSPVQPSPPVVKEEVVAPNAGPSLFGTPEQLAVSLEAFITRLLIANIDLGSSSFQQGSHLRW